jgi:hypothetical protein
MGNSEMTVSAFQSLNTGIAYLKANKDKYDTELYNKIMLDYYLHFGTDEYQTYSYGSNSIPYLVLTNAQHKAYTRIIELVKNAKIVSKDNSNKSKDEQKNNTNDKDTY